MTIHKFILYSLIAFLTVIATKTAVDELVMYRMEIDDGSTGLVIAVPRFDYCFYMLDMNDSGNQHDDAPMPSFIGSQQMGVEPGDESSRESDLRRVVPCLNRFAKTTGGSWWLKPESNHQNSKDQALDEINKEII